MQYTCLYTECAIVYTVHSTIKPNCLVHCQHITKKIWSHLNDKLRVAKISPRQAQDIKLSNT